MVLALVRPKPNPVPSGVGLSSRQLGLRLEARRMKTSRYTEEQISFALRQAEAGTSTIEVCRKLVISEQTSNSCWS